MIDPTKETPLRIPEAPPSIELHYFYDSDTKLSGYLVSVPDSASEGMAHNMASILKNAWNSSRTKEQRIHLLAHGVQQIEAHCQLPAPKPKRTLSRRLADLTLRVFGGEAK